MASNSRLTNVTLVVALLTLAVTVASFVQDSRPRTKSSFVQDGFVYTHESGRTWPWTPYSAAIYRTDKERSLMEVTYLGAANPDAKGCGEYTLFKNASDIQQQGGGYLITDLKGKYDWQARFGGPKWCPILETSPEALALKVEFAKIFRR